MRHEFIALFCKQCKLCSQGSNPSFCYNLLYCDEPFNFVDVMFPRLMEVRRSISSIGVKSAPEYNDDDLEYLLNYAFCSTKHCKASTPGDCVYRMGCMSKLRQQLLFGGETGQLVQLDNHRGREVKTSNKNKSNKAKYRQQQQVKKKPATATVLCTDSFLEEVTRILYGDGDSKQDTTETDT